VKCHNQLPDRPDGEEERVTGFSGDPDIDGSAESDGDFMNHARPAGVFSSDRVTPVVVEPAAPQVQTPDAALQGAAEGQMPDAALQGAAEGQIPDAALQGAAEGQAPDAVLQGAAEGQIPDAALQGAAEGQMPDAALQGAAEGQIPDAALQGPAAGQMPEAVPDKGAVPAGQEAYEAGQPGAPAGYDGSVQPQEPYSQGTDYTSNDNAGAAAGSFDRQPEGTVSGRIPARSAGAAPSDFEVGRGQTYGARQQYEARGGRYDASRKEQYGSAGYGYRQAPGETAQNQGRTDFARMNTAVGSKTILFHSRKMVKGFLFFMMALSFTLMIVMNFWNCVLPGTMDPSISNAQYNLNNTNAYLAGIVGSSNGFATQLISELSMHIVQMVTNVTGIVQQLGTSVQLAFLLILAVPNVLFALALWIMFIQTKRSRTKFGMGGYTLARVMMVLKFIVGCLILAIGLIISVYFVVVGASSAKFTSSFIQGLIMLIVMIVVAIFTIMYYVQWMFTLKCAKVNVRSGSDIGRVPVYVGVISIIMALLNAASIVPLAANDYIGIGAGASSALFFLFSGLWILVYHGYVKRPQQSRS